MMHDEVYGTGMNHDCFFFQDEPCTVTIFSTVQFIPLLPWIPFAYKIHCYYGTIPAANFRLCYAYGATGQILFSEPGLFSKLTVLRNFRIL